MMRSEILGLAAAAWLIGAAGMAMAADVAMPGDPVTGTFAAPSKEGDPLDHLPPGTRLLTSYGERAIFSPDGSKIAFVEKAYGDAFELDLRTGAIRNLTAHTPNSGILRVHYMKDGSYLLLAPRRIEGSKEETRSAHIELWWMDARAEGQMIPLGLTLFEGIAVSPTTNRIAWSTVSPRIGKLPRGIGGTSSLSTGEVKVSGGVPKIIDVLPLATRNWDECLLEAQDFYDGDRKLSATCYVMTGSKMPGAKPVAESQVYTIDTANGAMTRIPTPIELYAEAEGIFPDGKRTTVECGNDQAKGLDICLLELEPDAPRYTRLTFAQDYGAYRFSNPQVSRDGRKMAFQIGLAAEEAGSGRGILLMDLPAGF